jgi:hypothetical protein
MRESWSGCIYVCVTLSWEIFISVEELIGILAHGKAVIVTHVYLFHWHVLNLRKSNG